MSEKRFVQVGDTSIKDTLTGEKYYAPCEDGLLDLLNEQQATINELQGQINRLNYIIEELRKNNYNKFELINKMKKEEKLYAEEIVRLNNEIGELRETNKE